MKVFSDSRPKSAQKLILKFFADSRTKIICRLSVFFQKLNMKIDNGRGGFTVRQYFLGPKKSLGEWTHRSFASVQANSRFLNDGYSVRLSLFFGRFRIWSKLIDSIRAIQLGPDQGIELVHTPFIGPCPKNIKVLVTPCYHPLISV